MSSVTKLILPSGRPVLLTIDVDLFELDKSDWDALFGLVDDIKATANTWRASDQEPDVPTEPDSLRTLGLSEADCR